MHSYFGVHPKGPVDGILIGISLGDDQGPAARGPQRREVTSDLATLSQKAHSLRYMPDAVIQAYKEQKAGIIPATDLLLHAPQSESRSDRIMLMKTVEKLGICMCVRVCVCIYIL